MDRDEVPSSPKTTNSLHAHRLNHNPSKLPAFRFGDLKKRHLGASIPSLLSSPDVESALATPYAKQGTTSPGRDNSSTSTTSTTLAPFSPPKIHSTPPDASAASLTASYFPQSPSQAVLGSAPRVQDKRTRRAPASHSSNGIETFTGPPPALSTQRSFAADSSRTQTTSTSEWALAQQQLAFQAIETATTPATPIDKPKPTTQTPNTRSASRSLDDSKSSRPLIPPIRSFRSSATRATLEMNAKRSLWLDGSSDDQENDRDRTLRALEGSSEEERYERNLREAELELQRRAEPDDLFLNLARDTAQANGEGDSSSGNRRRSRIALASHRQSLPPSSSTAHLAERMPLPRRGSDLQGTTPPGGEASKYQRDRSTLTTSSQLLGDLNRSRYATSASQSTPSTPRGTNGRESSFPTQLSYGGRRQSIPESNGSTPQRLPGYRQSNLSYNSSRVFNSSPLVSRTMDFETSPETPRAAEGTESTNSTTAPSTVWDELDDLKSRIRKLELTGKLPSTSGAAVSQATGDRPPTATTTITTMSTSPKRGRGLSISPVESNGTGIPAGETHPLLHSALAKSKALLSADVYKALEATASDALAIAAMMGTAGQPGPISSSQSTIGGNSSGVTDRQLRRKADSMCRSLTELCLALSEAKPEPQVQPVSQALVTRPPSRDIDHPQASTRMNDSLSRMKSSPRALSRLEARRSSILAGSALPTPRYTPSSPGEGSLTPSQANFSGRRTSMLLRNRRAVTEEPDDDEARFRAPSRATTDIGRIRNPPKEYTSTEEPPPLPNSSPPSIQSSLPVRRHYASSSLNSGARRYLDRSTPERDTSSVISKLAEDRGQRLPQLNVQAFDSRNNGLSPVATLGRERLRQGSLQRRERESHGSVV